MCIDYSLSFSSFCQGGLYSLPRGRYGAWGVGMLLPLVGRSPLKNVILRGVLEGVGRFMMIRGLPGLEYTMTNVDRFLVSAYTLV